MAEEPSPVVRPLPGADPTPEGQEILHERVIEPIGGTTPARHNTALIFAGTAMVLGILWVNSGTGQQSSSRDLTEPAGAARERPDIVARETVAYAAVAPPRRPLGAPAAATNARAHTPPPVVS